MSAAIATDPRLVHAVPGRVRVHVPDLVDYDPRTVAARLRQVAGVRGVDANPLTDNILVRFDPHATDSQAILGAVRALERGTSTDGGSDGGASLASS